MEEERTRYKLCNIEILDSNRNICKLINKGNKRVVERVKMIYNRKSRTGLTVYNVELIEDTDLYLMVNRYLEFSQYKKEKYGTKGVVITVGNNCNELLDKENKVENIDYIVLENEEIEELGDLINKIRTTTDINEVVENYNKIRQFIENKADKCVKKEDEDLIIRNSDEKYCIKRTLYGIVKGNILSSYWTKKDNGFYVSYIGEYQIYLNSFNELCYIKVNIDYGEIYYRSNDTLAGYIVDRLVFSYNRLISEVMSLHTKNNFNSNSDEFIEVEE